MFSFERDVSGRLILAARKLLPDRTGIPERLLSLRNSQFRLRNIVVGMVGRGDFDMAVSNLTETLYAIGADFKFDFSAVNDRKTELGMDSLIVVLEALLAAFTELMIDLKGLPASAIDISNPNFHSMVGLFHWASVSNVPALDPKVASELLQFAMRVMPRTYVDYILSDALDSRPQSKLVNLLLSTSQFIYMSNPAVVLDAMSHFLNEWGSVSRKEFLCLGSQDSASLAAYLKLIRTYLPKLDSDDQLKLLHLAYISLTRSMISEPLCKNAKSVEVQEAMTSLIAAVNKTRPFKSLRAFRSYDGLVVTALELMLNVAKAEVGQERNAVTMSHTRPFERAAAILKKDFAGDRRTTSQIAAVCFFVNIGFYAYLVSERPGGEFYMLLALEVAPFTSAMVDAYDDLPEAQKMQLFAYCSRISHPKLQLLVPKVSAKIVFQVLQLYLLASKSSHFNSAISLLSKEFERFYLSAMKEKDFSTIYSALNILVQASPFSLPLELVRTVVSHTIKFTAENEDLDCVNREIMDLYITNLVKSRREALTINSLLPLIPDVAPVVLLQSPAKLKRIQLFLSLISFGGNDIQLKYYEEGHILHNRSKELRVALFLALCSDNNLVVEIALKCLEYLQSDPDQSVCERELLIELVDSSENVMHSIQFMQRRMAEMIASDADESLRPLADATREALNSNFSKTLSHKTISNIVGMRVATLPLEEPAQRLGFYSHLIEMDGLMLHAVATSVPLSPALASEFLRATKSSFQHISEAPESSRCEQLIGRNQVYTWLLNSLAGEHPFTLMELNLGELCRLAVANLGSTASVAHEISVLKFIETSAKYADEEPHLKSVKCFGPVVNMLLDRQWTELSYAGLGVALASIFRRYVVEDLDEFSKLAQRVSELNPETHHAQPLTRLLNANSNFALAISNRAIEANELCRTSAYEALSEILSVQPVAYDAGVDTSDFVAYLLENKPVLIALCDVCSVNGDNSVAFTLLKLFGCSSLSSQCQLVTIAISHEIEQSYSSYELFRGNSVTMGIIMDWLKEKASNYLVAVLSPALTVLRSAVMSDKVNAESLFEDILNMFKVRQLPQSVKWLISTIQSQVTSKFGKDIAHQAVTFMIVLRMICPAIISPKQFSIINRQPTSRFADVLKKFAGYIQRHKNQVCEYICEGKELEDIDEPHEDLTEKDCSSSQSDLDEDTMSSTRQVFHFLRKYAIEMRVILLSRDSGQYVASMFRFLRIGKDDFLPRGEQTISKLKGIRSVQVQKFRGIDMIVEKARDICRGEEAFYEAVQSVNGRNIPFLIDFTDYTGLFDRWVESLSQIAHTISQTDAQSCVIYALNCPRRTKSNISRLQAMTSLGNIEIEYLVSLDLIDEIEEIPSNLCDVQSAVEDISGAVRFPIKAFVGRSVTEVNLELYIGAKYMQFVGEGSCDVVPYVSPDGSSEYTLNIRRVRNDLYVLVEFSEFTILNVPASLLRVLKLSLIAAGAGKLGTMLDFASLNAQDSRPTSKSSTPPSTSSYQSSTATSVSKLTTIGTDECLEPVEPGKLLFWSLVDLFDDSERIRRSALEFYSTLPETWGIQLSIPSLQQKLTYSQVHGMAIAAAKAHPDLAVTVLCSLASMGIEITRVAAKVAAPWVCQLSSHNIDKVTLREKILLPLIKAIAAAPKRVGPILLEYFWPHINNYGVLIAELLVDVASVSDTNAMEALRQIPACMVPHGHHAREAHVAHELTQYLLDRLYSCFATPGNMSSTKWSQHPRWNEINACAMMFGSVSVDWQLAESLLCDVGVIILILTGVGSAQLRGTLHQLFIMYVNAFLQSPNNTNVQRQRLSAVRSEIMSRRGCIVFGVIPDSSDADDSYGDDYTEGAPEMFEYLGRLITETAVGMFFNRLAEFQETRVAIASRVKEYVDVPFPPIQRRGILSLIGSVRMLMPGYVVTQLIRSIAKLISLEGGDVLGPQGVLINAYLRMFSETIECIPDVGQHARCLFWVAICMLGTGCEQLQDESVRLLRECVKIEHYRGSFKTHSMAEIYLSSRPDWVDAIKQRLPFNTPSTEKNFHVALSVALVPVVGRAESRSLALKCCEVLDTASDGEFCYVVFLYMCGEAGKLTSRVPLHDFVDANDGVVRWLASRVKLNNPSSVIGLALCAQISGFAVCSTFTEISRRLLNLIQLVEDRRIVTMIAPLLMRTFSKLLKLGETRTEQELGRWTLCILSQSVPERLRIASDFQYLYNLVQKLGLVPWISETNELIPMFHESRFTGFTRFALGGDLNIWQRIEIDPLGSSEGEELF